MGRPAFRQFLTTGGATRGVRCGGEFATWDDLLAGGRALAAHTGPGRAFVVDPTAGLSAFAALFAVATVPDTTLPAQPVRRTRWMRYARRVPSRS